ncbi:hypothetical protein SAZ11_33695 [Streptomyces sp. FXJ1.4098]|uniref:hypothetical protein n=1 Tax=Streptomyces sp. NPDC020845 TaxID=3365096 RepID=UPI00299BF94C|nr:hypothetical protein [Streptomyces sp. FXJ1.4098]
MVSLTDQILPLAGVALGAAMSFLVSSLNERTRWRRQQSVRWDEHRLTAYAEYAHTVKELAARYQMIAAARGLVSGPMPLEPTPEVLAEIRELESRRSALSETLGLLGDTAANTASKTLDHCLWRLECLARGVATEVEQNWDQAYLEFRDARSRYIEQARTSLGVSGAVARDVAWPAAWRPVTRSPSSQ